MKKEASIERSKVLRFVDRVAELSGSAGVYMIIFVTVVLTYEAVARYFFASPTQWTQDISVTLQIWFTYMGMALVLKDREMIRITALLAIAPKSVRYVLEAVSLIIIFLFSLLAVTKGWDVVADSIRLGRRQPTMLALPNWIAELPVVLGFFLLLVQSTAELIRLPFRGPPDFSVIAELDPALHEAAQPSPHDEVRA